MPYWANSCAEMWKNRPYSPYPPSLLARKDWWDKGDVTWFLMGQTTNKVCQNRLLSLLIGEFVVEFVQSRQQKILKTIMANCEWKWSLVVFFEAVATVNVLTASNNDVKLAETRTTHFARLKSCSCFERMNKIDCDYSYRQIFFRVLSSVWFPVSPWLCLIVRMTLHSDTKTSRFLYSTLKEFPGFSL